MGKRYGNWFSSVDCVNFIHAELRGLVAERAIEVSLELDWSREIVWDIGADTLGEATRGHVQKRSNERGLCLVSATRFSGYQKRHDILVHAVARCAKVFEIHLTLVGAGETKAAVEELVTSLGIEKNVTFIPFVRQQKLWEMLGDCDLFCHPTEYEGLGKVVLEALSLGVPVLASDVPVLNKMIVDEYNGFLVENSPGAWAERLSVLHENRTLMNEVGRRAHAGFGGAAFDPRVRVNALLTFIEEELGQENSFKNSCRNTP